MKQTIIGDEKLFNKKTTLNIVITLLAVVIAVILNVIFTILRNEQNHLQMLILNVAVDCLFGWGAYAFASFCIFPKLRLKKLYNSPKSLCRGKIVDISVQTTRMRQFDCYTVTIGDDSQQILFLPVDFSVNLPVEKTVTFAVVYNVIVEVRYE